MWVGLRGWCAMLLVAALLCAEEVTVRRLPPLFAGDMQNGYEQVLLPGVSTERLEVVNRGSQPAVVEVSVRLHGLSFSPVSSEGTVEVYRREEIPPDGAPHLLVIRTPLAMSYRSRWHSWFGEPCVRRSEVRVNGRSCPLNGAGQTADRLSVLSQRMHIGDNRLVVSSQLAQVLPSNNERRLLEIGLPASEWPEDSLAYMGMPSVWLTPAEWRELREGTRTALRAYQRLGGQIFICAAVRQPTLPPWEELHRIVSQEGLGQVVELSDIRCLEALLMSPLSQKKPGLPDEQLMSQMRQLLSLPLPQMLHEERLEEQRIQPGDSERMSPLSMAIVLLLALLALGPGVMGWCCWRGFPLRALLLTPVLAVLVSLVILVCDRLRQPPMRSRLLAVTCLDQTRGEHSSYGLVSVLAPNGMDGSLSFPANGRLELYRQQADLGLRQQDTRLVSDGGILNHGLPTQYGVFGAGLTEARLELSFDGEGRCHVVNRLGVRLRELCVVGPDGRCYVGGELPPGETGTLTPEPPSPQTTPDVQAWQRAFLQVGDVDGALRQVALSGALPRGSYVGLSDQALLVEPGMSPGAGKVCQVVFGSFGGWETKEAGR